METKEILKKLKDGEIDLAKAKALLQKKAPSSEIAASESAVPPITAVPPVLTLSVVEDYILEIMSKILKYKKEQIRVDTEFENYGIDSIVAINLTSAFEKDLGNLSKTLFFEFKTIRELAEYFFKNHAVALSKKLVAVSTAVKQNPVSEKKAIGQKQQQLDVKKPVPLKTVRVDINQAQEPSVKPSVQSIRQDIAIIGLSGRYPKSANIDEFWEHLKNGNNLISEIPKHRWESQGIYDSRRKEAGKVHSKWGGFLDDIESFDPLLFKIPPLEAELMDPQERLFLQAAWEVFEDAGYHYKTLSQTVEGKISVYVGAMYDEYPILAAYESLKGNEVTSASGNLANIANRVSYFFDLQGPSMTVCSMCSSGISAVYLACQDLRAGASHLALAGGVNLSIHPNKYLQLSLGGMLSSDGLCKSFSKGGDGFVPSEGVGAVLLKRLDEAIRDRDHIYGIIKAVEINNAGRSNGYRVPTPLSQERVIESALQSAKIDPRQISYVEAHGTGTNLGDPIEIEGLKKAFSKYTSDVQFCAIGSVKSNTGHCEAAAGMAGLTKILMQFKHKLLVPSIHSAELNSKIDFENTPFIVQRELKEWRNHHPGYNGESPQTPLLAALSSFGAGGSNAHMIIQEYLGSQSSKENNTAQLIPLSARSQEQLYAYAGRLNRFISHSKQLEHSQQQEERSRVLALQQLFAECLAIPGDAIDIDFEFEDLKIGAYEERLIIERLNQSFGIQLSHADIRKLQSIRKLCTYLDKKKKAEEQVQTGSKSDISINDLAFTLQVGREPLPHRMAILASSLQELSESLSVFLSERSSADVILGKADSDALPIDSAHYRAGNKDSLRHLALAWVKGAELDWSKLWMNQSPFRISLPTYPFERRKCWVLSDQLQSFSYGSSNKEGKRALKPEEFFKDTVFATPTWMRADKIEKSKLPLNCKKILAYAGSAIQTLEKQIDPSVIKLPIQIAQNAPEMLENFQKVFTFIQDGIRSKEFSSASLVLVVPMEYFWNFSPFLGFFKSLHQEKPSFLAKIILIPDFSKEVLEALATKLDDEWLASDQLIKYNADCTFRQVECAIEVFAPGAIENKMMKADGVYWITGGIGGLGRLFVKHFDSLATKGTIVLSGRSPPTPALEKELSQLAGEQLKLEYVACDVSDLHAVKKTIAHIIKKFGKLDGVIHSAGVIRDGLFINKPKESIREVFLPKLFGALNIDEATQNLPLDYFILFSSEAGFFGNVGQTDYSAANSFLNAFSEYRETLRAQNKRQGITKSINWPLWEEGGMQVSKEIVELIEKNYGMIPLTSERGTCALEYMLNMPCRQIFIAQGHPDKIKEVLAIGEKKADSDLEVSQPVAPSPQALAPAQPIRENSENIDFQIEAYETIAAEVKKIFSLLTSLEEADIDVELTFQDYGVDSVTLTDFANRVGSFFEVDLAPTVFFEYPIIKDFLNYLVELTKVAP